MTHPDPAYRYELEKLAEICAWFVDAHDAGDGTQMMLAAGALTGQCATIYNLEKPAGIMHPALLFNGAEQALEEAQSLRGEEE